MNNGRNAKVETMCTWRRICVPVHRKADTSEPIISKASSRIKIICVKILATAHPKMAHTFLKRLHKFSNFYIERKELTRRMLKDIGCKSYSEVKLDWSPCIGVPIGVMINLKKTRVKMSLKFVLDLVIMLKPYIYRERDRESSAYIWHLKVVSLSIYVYIERSPRCDGSPLGCWFIICHFPLLTLEHSIVKRVQFLKRPMLIIVSCWEVVDMTILKL